MKNLKNLSIASLAALLLLFLLANCSGDQPSSKDFTVKTETKTESPKKEVAKKEEPAKETTGAEKDQPDAEAGADKEFMNNKGIGPVKSLELGELDDAMAAEGKVIYDKLCTSCHKPTRRFVGPAPKGILERRSPEWVMNMILNPEQMVKEDPIAKALLVEYNLSPMANQNLTEEEARKVLEYFRTL